MRLFVLLFIFFSLQAYEVDYAKLEASKEAFKAEQKLHKALKKSTRLSKYKNYIKIIHKDMHQLHMQKFTKMYGLELYKCLVGNICIYKYNGKLTLEELMEKIKKEETNVQAIYKYGRRNLVAF